GGRREGRESEQQRPNMSRHLFASAVLLLVVIWMCCVVCGAVAKSDFGDVISVTGGESISNSLDAARKADYDSFRATPLVEVDGVVVVVAESHYKNPKDGELYVGIAAKSLKGNEKKWMNGKVVGMDHFDTKVDRLLSPTSSVCYGDMNVLLVGSGMLGASLTDVTGDEYWMARYANGRVSAGCCNRDMKEFEWDQYSTSNPTGLLKYLKPNCERFKQFLGGSAGVRPEDGSCYVLPIRASNGDGNSVFLLSLPNVLRMIGSFRIIRFPRTASSLRSLNGGTESSL
ncbi:trans-sialidase, putative, partial [Trypanosoma cruzi marinkellei]